MSKEHAYAYEAGYRDGSINYELEHCPACKNVADLQEALAENAKLREQNHWLKQGDILHVLTDQEYIDQCERERLMQASIDALDKDNAKLRELCETVIDDWMSKVCPTFPFCECGGEYESCADDTCGNQLYRQMLRELGEGGGLVTAKWQYKQAYEAALEHNHELAAENAKLRELVRDMHGLIPGDCLDYCKHGTADDGCCKIGECWYDRRMRELGVEVDA